MARKFEIQLKSWIPLIIESYFTYDTLNTLEIIKQSGSPLAVLGANGQVNEILSVLNFMVNAEYLKPTIKTSETYFGITFDSYTYDILDKFIDLINQGKNKAETKKHGDWIEQIKVESTTPNKINVFNFNLTFILEKLIEVKAGLLNL